MLKTQKNKLSLCTSCFAVSIFFLAGGCSPRLKDDQIIARVNTEVIKVRDYRTAIEQLKFSDQPVSKRDSLVLKNVVLKSLIRRTVMLNEAKRRGLSISNRELEDTANNFKTGYQQGGFEQTLLDQRIDPDLWLEHLRGDLLIEKLHSNLNYKPSKPSLREALLFYEANAADFKVPASAKLLQIVFAQQKAAEDAAMKLKASPDKFREIVKELNSSSEEADSIENTVTKGLLPDEIDKVIFSAPLNRVIGPLKTSYGFTIFKILSRSPSLNRDFETVRKEIEVLLMGDQKARFIKDIEDSLIRAASIDYDRKLISAL
jgi:parvulin-like peptidyl-prolyl isomerase